jgi:hypothetical protein
MSSSSSGSGSRKYARASKCGGEVSGREERVLILFYRHLLKRQKQKGVLEVRSVWGRGEQVVGRRECQLWV